WPDVAPIGYRQAVERALERTMEGEVPTRWSNALGGSGESHRMTDWEGSIREVRSIRVHAAPRTVFDVVSSLGGETGWLVWDSAWRLRGAMDRVAGGPGLRRGRRDPRVLLPGEAVDFWRVE